MDFLLFEFMSRLLIDELFSILSAYSFVNTLSEFLRNGVDSFELMCVAFLFSFRNFSVLPFLVCLEDSADFESVISSLWIDQRHCFAWKLEVLLCRVY